MRGLGANPCDYDDGANGRGDTGCAQPLDVAALVDFVKSDHLPHSVIVDCSTADGDTSDHAAWLSQGLHVVSGYCFARDGDVWVSFRGCRCDFETLPLGGCLVLSVSYAAAGIICSSTPPGRREGGGG